MIASGCQLYGTDGGYARAIGSEERLRQATLMLSSRVEELRQVGIWAEVTPADEREDLVPWLDRSILHEQVERLRSPEVSGIQE